VRNQLLKSEVHGNLRNYRRSYGTMDRRINVKVIAERLGNTVEMIYTIYGHVLKELELRAVDLFAESLATGCVFGAGSS
jgi:integrase